MSLIHGRSNSDLGKSKMSSTAPAPRGSFIVLEGLDRAGKTTQVQLLAEALERQGKTVRRLRFPGTHSPSFSSASL